MASRVHPGVLLLLGGAVLGGGAVVAFALSKSSAPPPTPLPAPNFKPDVFSDGPPRPMPPAPPATKPWDLPEPSGPPRNRAEADQQEYDFGYGLIYWESVVFWTSPQKELGEAEKAAGKPRRDLSLFPPTAADWAAAKVSPPRTVSEQQNGPPPSPFPLRQEPSSIMAQANQTLYDAGYDGVQTDSTTPGLRPWFRLGFTEKSAGKTRRDLDASPPTPADWAAAQVIAPPGLTGPIWS